MSYLPEQMNSVLMQRLKSLKRENRLKSSYRRSNIAQTPFEGLGKPEPLKHKYSGFWSRRIDEEHRLIYKYEENQILIAKCRFHYD